ncbi:hypothetical protein PpBr36_00417 [Pyricularia pennisetigena]|uniref:hypothetical protein n=1 Tax=Pyricularia pennisetigena TaxID=1578925 RepID=UPI00114F91C4|nr:hypothetical protein PpBr36_00417 [Pyricularia pennisetigena]TLS29626.1 hypothetical protein PpBr36_00417 [Pyricularia pennisetigena]
MATDACSPQSKVDRWLNQLILRHVSGHSSPLKVLRRRHQRKGQGPYRDKSPNQELNVSTAPKRVHDDRGQCGDSVCQDKMIEIEKWISKTVTSPGQTRQRPSSHISGNSASQSPQKPPQRRHSRDYHISTGNLGHKRKRSPSEASCGSRPKQRIQRSSQFEKRPRHKTREDRYDMHHSKHHPRKVTEARADGNMDRDRQRSRKAALLKPSRGVVAKFTSDAILSERVTTHPGPGLFGKFNAIKRPLVDLEFHDMNFLKAPYEELSAKNASRARVREKNRQERLNEEVSAFFTKAAPVSKGPHHYHHRPTTSNEYWTMPDRLSATRSDLYPSQSRHGSAGRTPVRNVNKHPRGSSGDSSSPLKQELLQRLEQIGCPDQCNANSLLTGSSSLGKITRSIIETGVLDGTVFPRRSSFAQPSNHQNLDCDASLLQPATNPDLSTMTINIWNHPRQLKKNQDLKNFPTQVVPPLPVPTAQKGPSPMKQAHVLPSEEELSVDTQGCTNLPTCSIKSLPSSIPARPQPPKSRLVQILQKAADNFALSQPHENPGGQVITELQADQGLRSPILQPSLSNLQQHSIAPNAVMTLLPPNPDLHVGFPPRHVADSRLHHNTAGASTSPLQPLSTSRKDFYGNHAPRSPSMVQEAPQLTANHRQSGKSADMAQYIAMIESEILGVEPDSKPNDTGHDGQWEQDTETYDEPIEHSQDGYITGRFTRSGLTLPLAVEEETGLSMVDFWTRNPFVN